MKTVTYLTDTNHDPYSHYILDEDIKWDDTTLRDWFEGDVLPGDEIADFREALIRAVVRLNGEDREFLADNGFILTTIPVIWNENNIWIPFCPAARIAVYCEVFKVCLKHEVSPGLSSIFDTLSVLEHMGNSDIVSIIEPLGCEIKGE